MIAAAPPVPHTRIQLPPATLVLLGVALFRLLYLPLFCAVTDLAGDESYYWDWGRHPDWGYFSKPPLIGWLMGAVAWLTGNAEWGIRLAALLCGTASLWLLQALATRMAGERAALLVVLLTALTPANTALNLFFTIDAPLVLCWSAALLALWRCMEAPDKSSRWLVLGLALGVGNLAKQMMLVFPVLMLMFFALTTELRPLLRRAALWWSLAISLLFLGPVLWWQQQHHWVTLGHMSHHFDTAEHVGVLGWVGRFLSFPASQAGLFTPVTWVLLIGCAFGALFRWRTLDVKQRFLTLFSAPALLVFFALALRQNVNPNWPAVYYLSAMVLLAMHLAHTWERSRKITRTALVVAAVMTLLAYGLPLAIPYFGFAGDEKLDPLERLRGWSEAGGQAGELLSKAPHPERTFFLALGHRDNASQLAFYTPQHPPMYRWQPDGIMASQYELWPSMHERTGWDALIFQPFNKPPAKSLEKQFTSVEWLSDIHIALGNGDERMWRVFLARGLKETPQ
jgi:4-amino-4-deoxy-L-arabinose transferase-like glycosyltransferase